MTQAKVSGIYWGRLTDDVIAKLATWNTVILNESNIWSNPEQPEAHLAIGKLKALNPYINIVISFNAISVFAKDTDTKGNIYYPVQQLIFQAAEETGAWLKHNGQFMTQQDPSDQVKTRMFDLRIPAFRYRLVDIINTAMTNSGAKIVHWDELHYTLMFLNSRYPGSIPSDVEWSAANASLLRMVDFPVMGNGNYDVSKYHKTKSRGRYVQTTNSLMDTLSWLKSDLELPIKQRLTIINPVGEKNSQGNFLPLTDAKKKDWAKFGHGTGAGMQYWANGVPNQYKNPNLETLSF